MLLLNVSDIHFHHPVCNTPMDPDRPYRTRLIQDVRTRVRELGPVDAILVGGDIAYAGAPEEYTAAYAWISDLAKTSGCDLERVFVIPGNHDVDRNVVRKDINVRNVQAAISRAEPQWREQELFKQFSDATAGRALFAPIAAFNDFAKRFSCQVYTPDKLFWEQNLSLDHETVLRFYGLTSTLLSGMNGENDVRQALYLSPLQTAIDPTDGVVNVVLCHHPPDWFMDHDDIDDAIRGRAALHFFGHKHRQRIHRDANYVRFSAGAVNPDRNEPGWEPGYNLIRVETSTNGRDRVLSIEAHLLVWQTNPDMFRPKRASDTDEVFRHQLPLGRALAVEHSVEGARTPASTVPATISPAVDVETEMSDDNTRNLVLRFWELASSERREIAMALGLLDAEDMRLPEPERYDRAFVRAGERALLTRFAAEIAKREKH
jgi:predicted MPP superfamily phosphohydrolase